jgi:hypothetical protein
MNGDRDGHRDDANERKETAMSEMLTIGISVAGFLAVIGWVIRTVVVNWRLHRTAKLQAEIQQRLLERFESTDQLAEFLGGEAGARFLESATFERNRPHGRILGSIQAGVIVTFVSIALLWLHGQWHWADEELLFLGALGLALGLGFLASAGVAYALSKSWGLMNGHEPSGLRETPERTEV